MLDVMSNARTGRHDDGSVATVTGVVPDLHPKPNVDS
jgi:hypothetical protein